MASPRNCFVGFILESTNSDSAAILGRRLAVSYSGWKSKPRPATQIRLGRKLQLRLQASRQLSPANAGQTVAKLALGRFDVVWSMSFVVLCSSLGGVQFGDGMADFVFEGDRRGIGGVERR